jgi:putative restriction endonuclease
LPGVRPGTFFRDRQELHERKLHRGLQRGIAPHGSSIVHSGGYVDDEDMSDVIIYTGEGGRDPNTGRQIADQRLISGNKALAENHLSGIPIRVHRGFTDPLIVLATSRTRCAAPFVVGQRDRYQSTHATSHPRHTQ